MKKNKISKKKFIILLVISLLTLILIFLFLYYSLNTENRKTTTVVSLDININDVYRWDYKIDDNSIVEYVETKRYGDLEGKSDGKVNEKYYFKALKPGKTTISFTNKNIGNGTYEEIKYYDVIVNDDLEIKIEKQKRVAN